MLSDKYVQRNGITNVKKSTQEMKIIEKEFSQAHNVETESQERGRDESSSVVYCAFQRFEDLQVEERKARERAGRLEAKLFFSVKY